MRTPGQRMTAAAMSMTSNPLIANDIPTLDESFMVISFDDPGGKMGLAMQLIFTPLIIQLMDRKRRAR